MKKNKIIQVGCGYMSGAWGQHVLNRADSEFVAVVDLNPNAAKAFAEKYAPNVPVFDNLSAALKNTDADIIFDVTIPEAHEEVTLQSFEAGCAVFSEKPMSSSLESCRKLVKASDDSGNPFFIMQNRRYLKHLRNWRAFIESGESGEPSFTCAQFFVGVHFGGFRERMAHPLLLDMAIHTFDAARFLTGKNAVSVWCHEFNMRNSWFDGSASAVVTFRMEDGSVYNYSGSWSSAAHFTSFESSWRMECEKGAFIWDGDSTPVFEWPVKELKKDQIWPDRTHGSLPELYTGREGHDGCLDELFNAYNEKRPAETNCHDNLETIKMVFGAIESARQGCEVKLDEL